jgi:hypothetical protein
MLSRSRETTHGDRAWWRPKPSGWKCSQTWPRCHGWRYPVPQKCPRQALDPLLVLDSMKVVFGEQVAAAAIARVTAPMRGPDKRSPVGPDRAQRCRRSRYLVILLW